MAHYIPITKRSTEFVWEEDRKAMVYSKCDNWLVFAYKCKKFSCPFLWLNKRLLDDCVYL